MLKLSLILIAIACAYGSDVIELGDSDFESRTTDMDIALVKFYAPWCGHCKKMAPEFDKAAAVLKNNDPPVSLIKVDCTGAGKSTCDKYDVQGFPTLKLFTYGELVGEYKGGRDFDGIIKYMKGKAGPTAKQLKTADDVQAYLDKRNEATVFGFFEKGSDLQKAFQKAADALSEDFTFAYSIDEAAAKKMKHKDEIVIYRPKLMSNKFEENEIVYDGEAKLSDIKPWVSENIFGLCGHRTPSSEGHFKRPLVVAYYEVDYVKNAKGTNYWRNRVMKVGKKLQDEGINIHFAISNKEEYSHELNEFGMPVDSDAPVVAARDAKEKKYVMKSEFSMDNLEEFARAFIKGEIEAYLKSEDLPADNDGPVKVVVAKNFEEIVNDATKDVLIEFYAPWCGHCKSLAPKYEELGEKLAKEESIVIAKMDATANDVPKPFEVSGFPTLYFVPKNNKNNPQKYNGGREVSDFIKYIAKEATSALKGYDRNGKKKKSEL